MKAGHHVLVVDDSDDDLVLMRLALKQAGYPNDPQTVTSGAAAIAYLKGEGPYSDRSRYPLPALMMLDVNMPGTPGFEVLRWVRAQPEIKRLCVYILTASTRPEDVRRAFDLGANAYFVKPSDLDDLVILLAAIRESLRHAHFAPLTSTP